MPPLGDIGRLLNGAALVACEAARRSLPLEAARSGNVETLASRILKQAILSATDISGLTKGTIREVSSPKQKDSVVYFSDPLPEPSVVPEPNAVRDPTPASEFLEAKEDVTVRSEKKLEDSNVGGELGSSIGNGGQKDLDLGNLGDISTVTLGGTDTAGVPVKRRRPRERRVPSTPFTRALGFAGLGAGLAWGTFQESARRVVYGMPESEDKQSVVSPFLSEQNAERLALALCRMRGAALKLGQMLSIQDESLVPAPEMGGMRLVALRSITGMGKILAALEIVRQGADIMPRSQLNNVLDAELGPDWSSKLRSFDYEPLAAASIGQVHRAVMKDGLEVAMKIQYPGVADSIESDIENVRLLLNYTNLIPKGLFLDRAIKVAKEELSQECDYILEAANQKRFHQLLSYTEGFYVPAVIDEISSRKVLTTELVSGIPIDQVALLDQKSRDHVGKKLLELTLKELFIFRFMQTDPNWGNFLYDEASKKINLIDFGAAREYPQNFVDDYLGMVLACANTDRDAVIEMSRRLGFLTGDESEVMLEAHVQAGFIVGVPFSRPGGYDFHTTNITQSISNLGATMLKHRLTPPPDEAYSLHRKLSGAFLACIKLRAVVPCRELLLEVHRQHGFSTESRETLSSS